MANAVVTIKIMPESPDVNLAKIQEEATKIIKEFKGEVGRAEIEPIAFGLKAIKLIFVIDENLGSTDALEQKIGTVDGVQSVDVTDVRRAIG
jgi:elongation factor 1-beta